MVNIGELLMYHNIKDIMHQAHQVLLLVMLVQLFLVVDLEADQLEEWINNLVKE
jgi:hypothetical protein